MNLLQPASVKPLKCSLNNIFFETNFSSENEKV